MYHHFILTRDEKETIHKIYKKQKEEFVKGDWFQLLKEDFQFINIVAFIPALQDKPLFSRTITFKVTPLKFGTVSLEKGAYPKVTKGNLRSW